MGNQLFKNYDVEKEPQCVGGQNGIWKIYNAVKQDSTKRKVSIWTFDKKNITDKAAKSAREEIAAFLKKEATSMMKIRHPNIVNLVEPVIEDKQSMAFITERVDDNLYNLMKKNDYQSICQSELELKLQVENILKVLLFLHNDVKTAHLGISPENIFIVNGQWKIAGFTFSTPVQQQSLTDVQNIDYTKRPFDNYCQFYPNLSFSSPEVAEIPSKCTFASDIFSLSLLIMLMYQIKYMQTTNVTPLMSSKTVGEYSQQLANIQNQFKTQNYIQRDMSEDFKKLVSRMLAKTPSSRPTIEQIKESPWMNDPFVKAIYMLDNIVELDQNKQINFLAGMSNILFKYEKPVIKKRIVPQLLDLTKFEYLIPPILNVVTDCLKQPDLYSTTEFQSDLQPFVVGLTKRKSIPGKALYSLVMNCETYFKFFEKNEFQNVYLAPVLKCFDIPQLQGYVLSQCDLLMSKLDYQFTKSKLLPRILILCTSNVPKIMKQAITTLKKIIPSLDKHILNDQVLTTLDKLRKMTITDKSIPMLILDIYQQISKSLDILVVGQRILPSLIPYLIDNSLGKKEFDAYLNAVNTMIKQIENERRKQIKDSDGGQDDIPVNNIANNQNNDGDDLFQFDNKPTNEQKNVQGKEFDFLSMFDDKSKQGNTAVAGNSNIAGNNQPIQINMPIKQSNTLNANQGSKPASQIDFNFDMFDNIPNNNGISSPSSSTFNNNIINNNPNNGISSNIPINNENNDFFNSVKPTNNNMQNSQKLQQNTFVSAPKQPEKQPDLFSNIQQQQKQQINANDLFQNSNANQFGQQNNNTNLYSNYNQGNQNVQSQFQPSSTFNNNNQPQTNPWGQKEDPFSNMMGGNMQIQNNNNNNNNNNNINPSYQQQQPNYNAFNNMNNNNFGQNNAMDDLFGPTPAINNNNNFNINNNMQNYNNLNQQKNNNNNNNNDLNNTEFDLF